MSAIQQLLTDHLDIWTAADTEKKSGRGRSAGNGVSVYGIKKLRELILELAVRGKLVPQNPNDEPASELLKTIQAERAKLVAAGKIKKGKPLLPISDEEQPFDLPLGWAWVPLGSLCQLENGDRSKNYPNKTTLVERGVPFVNAGHLVAGLIDRNEMTFITQEHFDLLRSGKFINGDILFCLRGSLGKSAIVDGFETGAIASSLVIIRIHPHLSHRYFLNYFDSPLSYQMIKKYDNGTAQPNLSATDLAKFLVPLPSLDEQHRIVAKIDELMALCDQLETQHNNAADAHEKLLRQLLTTLTQSKNADEFSENWQRIAAHFDSLFTTESSIDTLKQTLLQLAVMGKLVPQDPNDEAGSDLLTRIQKSRLDKRKIVSCSEELISSATDWLPKSWGWASVDQLSSNDPFAITDGPFGANLKTSHYVDTCGHRVVRLQNIGNGVFIDEHQAFIKAEHFKKLSRHQVYSGDLVVAGLIDTIIRCCQIPEHIGPAIVKADCYRFSVHSFISARYVLYYLISRIANEFASVHHHGLTLTRIGLGNFRGIPVPLPPAKEQVRIVAKIEELMALCDQLKFRITDANRLQQKLADAMVWQALTSENQAEKTEEPNRSEARALLGAEIIHQLHAEKTFGQVKLQKILHLCEHIAEIGAANGEYQRYAAGPHDPEMISDIESTVKRNEWYEEYPRDKVGHAYRPLKQAGEHSKKMGIYWQDKLPVILKLIELMRKWETERCEIFSTLYAAWNDLILFGKPVTDEAILSEVLERWHKRKTTIAKQKWLKELEWMRNEGFIPKGYGRATRAAGLFD